MTTDIVNYQGSATAAVAPLFGTDDPAAIVARATAIAGPLARVVREQKLFVTIQSGEHVTIGGWTLLGSMLGVFPITAWTRRVERDGVSGWEARVEARTLSGAVAGAAEAQCLDDEQNWTPGKKSDNQRRSMAQTRAASKALRMPLGFVMALAGYEATPAEEMEAFESTARAAGRGVAQPPNARRQEVEAQVAAAARRDAPPLPATEPQIKAIHTIARAFGLSETATEARCVDLFGVQPSELNRQQASEFIEALKAEAAAARTRKREPEPEPAAAS